MANKKTKEQRKAIRKQGRQEFSSNAKEFGKLSAQIAGQKATGMAIDKITGTGIGSKAADKATKHLKSARRHNIVGATKGLIKSVFNHPEWYTHYNPEFINVNLATRIGIPSPVVGETVYNVSADGTSAFNEIRFPGTVACVNYEAVIPKGDQEGYNLGLNRIFTQMRAANSGAVNYDMADLKEYVYAARKIFMIHSGLARLIKILNSYSMYDATIPDNILKSLGLNAQGILLYRTQLANLTNLYNNFGLWIEANVVGKWDLLERSKWLEGNVFRDSDDKKHQYILFCNTLMKQVLETNKVEEMMAVVEIVKLNFQSLAKSSIIAGDLIKQSVNNIYKHTILNSTDSLDIVYDEYILTQFQNTTLQSIVITQQNGTQVVNKPSYTEQTETFDWVMNEQLRKLLNIANTGKLLFNSPTDQLNAGRILSLTRFMSIVDTTDANTVEWIPVRGTEVAYSITTVFNKNTTNTEDSPSFEAVVHEIGGINLLFMVAGDPGSASPVSQLKQLARTIEAWSNIDFFPMIRWGYALFNTDDDSTTYGIMGNVFDINVFGYIDKDQLASYNNAADASLLYMETPVRTVSSSTSLTY